MLALALAVVVAAAPPAHPSNAAAFKKLTTKAKVRFTQPRGFTEVPIQQNEAMSYDFALVDPTKRLEIRIAVRPFQPPAPEAPGVKVVRVSDENVFPAMVQATTLNLTSGESMKTPEAFDSTAVRNEFNADQGFTTFVEAKADGWSGKKCLLYAIRKAGVAEVYVFFLFEDPAPVQSAIDDAFHLVKFK